MATIGVFGITRLGQRALLQAILTDARRIFTFVRMASYVLVGETSQPRKTSK